MRFLPMLGLWCVTSGCLAQGGPQSNGTTDGESRSYEIANGRWLVGGEFILKDAYVVEGRLTDERPVQVDSILDLAGGFVVPPFGDAHTHNLDGAANLDSIRNAYVREGTFYVQVLTNTRSRSDSVRWRFNQPGELDVRYANGALTSTLGHPFMAYEPRPWV